MPRTNTWSQAKASPKKGADGQLGGAQSRSQFMRDYPGGFNSASQILI